MPTRTVKASFPPLPIAKILDNKIASHVSLLSIFGHELFLKKFCLLVHVEIDETLLLLNNALLFHFDSKYYDSLRISGILLKIRIV